MVVYPADVVLFEGILMFYSQEIRDLFQMKLFVDTDADTRLSRRGETCKHDWTLLSGDETRTTNHHPVILSIFIAETGTTSSEQTSCFRNAIH